MSSFKEIREWAGRHGFRELCTDAFPTDGVVFTHLETDDGTRYQLVNKMTGRDLVFAAEAKQRLLIVIPEDKQPLASVSVYATARVIEFYDKISDAVAKMSGQETAPYVRPWVQTQNQRYWLVEEE